MTLTADVLEEHAETLARSLEALADGDKEKAAGTLAGALAAAATGLPWLAPLVSAGVARLLLNETDQLFARELAALEAEEREASARARLARDLEPVFRRVVAETLDGVQRAGQVSAESVSRSHRAAVRDKGAIDSKLLHPLHLIPVDRLLTNPALFVPGLMEHYSDKYRTPEGMQGAVERAIRIAVVAGHPFKDVPRQGGLPNAERTTPDLFWPRVFLAFDDKGPRLSGALLLLERDNARMSAGARRGWVVLWNYLVTGEIEPELLIE